MTRLVFAPWVWIGLFLVISGCTASQPVTLTLAPATAVVFSSQSVQLIAADSKGISDVAWSVGGISGGNVDMNGMFTAPSVTSNTIITVTASSRIDATKTASTAITVLASGTVTTTGNLQVAQYTLTPPPGANVFIQFGTDTSYNLKTWTLPAPSSGPLSFYVAGMLAATDYHMRAVVLAADGSTANDTDHMFTTQTVPSTQIPQISVSTTPGMTPQPGIEIVDMIGGSTLTSLSAVDLSGRLIWAYPQPAGTNLQGAHLLPNGHFLICLYQQTLREIDLANNTIQQETIAQLNASFSAANLTYQALNFNHDVIALPNGHWIGLVQIQQPCSAIPNCSGVSGNILGDVIVDLAPNGDGTFSLAWSWSTFDHLDINRAPVGYPDWTHSNALLYSPDDGNLLLSIRHQSWILKIDYANGTGVGDIIWKLGRQGDFSLAGGTDPTDWFYAQHGPSFVGSATSGKFTLAIMDNGNWRVFAPGVACGTSGNPPCYYSRGVEMEIDENAKTATLVNSFSPGEYSAWGGNAQQLANGNLESDFNAGLLPNSLTDLFEVTGDSAHSVVWNLKTTNQNAYRAFRLPSLYPGVQW